MDGQVPEGLDPVDLDDPAVADDRDPVAHLLDLVDEVWLERKTVRLAALASLTRLDERLLDERVEARGRLVQDQQVGLVLEGDDEADLLLVALGVLAELAGRVQVQAFDQRALVRSVDAAPEVGEVGDRLAAGEPVVERELAGQVADAAVDRHRVGRRLDVEDERAPGGRTDQVEQDPDRRRLARAVGPEIPEDLTGVDAEVEVDDATVLAVGLGQLFDPDDGTHARLLGCGRLRGGDGGGRLTVAEVLVERGGEGGRDERRGVVDFLESDARLGLGVGHRREAHRGDVQQPPVGIARLSKEAVERPARDAEVLPPVAASAYSSDDPPGRRATRPRR